MAVGESTWRAERGRGREKWYWKSWGRSSSTVGYSSSCRNSSSAKRVAITLWQPSSVRTHVCLLLSSWRENDNIHVHTFCTCTHKILCTVPQIKILCTVPPENNNYANPQQLHVIAEGFGHEIIRRVQHITSDFIASNCPKHVHIHMYIHTCICILYIHVCTCTYVYYSIPSWICWCSSQSQWLPEESWLRTLPEWTCVRNTARTAVAAALLAGLAARWAGRQTGRASPFPVWCGSQTGLVERCCHPRNQVWGRSARVNHQNYMYVHDYLYNVHQLIIFKLIIN